MGGWLGALGQQAAGQAVGGALAMGLQRLGVNYDNRKQRQQAEALQNIQIAGEKQLIDYNKNAEYNMWLKTNYPAQKEQLKEAELNPALMYGMSGGGGVTTGGGSPSVGSQHAASPNTASAATTGMALMSAAQLKLMNAQAENLNAQTNKTNAEIPNVGKQGTLLDVQAQDITQGITQSKARVRLTNAQERILQFEGNVKEETMDDTIKGIHAATITSIYDARRAGNETQISDATIRDKIEIIKATAIQVVLQNALLKATEGKVGAETINIKAELPSIQYKLKDMMTQNAQGWNRLSIDEQRNLVNNALESMKVDLEDRGQVIDAIRDIIGLGLLTGKGGSTTVPVRGFHSR